jgi:hypothetical protein
MTKFKLQEMLVGIMGMQVIGKSLLWRKRWNPLGAELVWRSKSKGRNLKRRKLLGQFLTSVKICRKRLK